MHCQQYVLKCGLAFNISHARKSQSPTCLLQLLVADKTSFRKELRPNNATQTPCSVPPRHRTALRTQLSVEKAGSLDINCAEIGLHFARLLVAPAYGEDRGKEAYQGMDPRSESCKF